MKIKRFEKEISVEEYISNYVNVEEFLECCKECPNYEKKWSCPSYDFNPINYWKAYNKLHLVAMKIDLSAATNEEDCNSIMLEVKRKLSEELYTMEKKYTHSISLSAGSCNLCDDKGCTRKLNRPCRFPDKMRYSIEALGGNVGLTLSNLMGLKLEWIEDGKLPEYYILVCGFLY